MFNSVVYDCSSRGWRAEQALPVVNPAGEGLQSQDLMLKRHVQSADIEWMLKLAEDNQTEQRVLASLSYHDDLRVRAAVADNPNTPFVTMLRLARDQSHDIRYQIAENHNVPIQVLLILARDENPYVSMRAESTLTRLNTHKRIA